jgi:hypothetical protein
MSWYISYEMRLFPSRALTALWNRHAQICKASLECRSGGFRRKYRMAWLRHSAHGRLCMNPTSALDAFVASICVGFFGYLMARTWSHRQPRRPHSVFETLGQTQVSVVGGTRTLTKMGAWAGARGTLVGARIRLGALPTTRGANGTNVVIGLHDSILLEQEVSKRCL